MAVTAEQILKLKQDVERTQQLRQEADVALKLAEQKQAAVDDELRGLGVEPDNAEAELAALDAQIEKSAAELSAALAAEQVALQDILQKAREAGVIR